MRLRTNNKIETQQVRVVFENGGQEIMSTRNAISIAERQGLDLIEIQPKAFPPICKIADYGKYMYEREKREKALRKKQKNVSVKEIRFHPNIDKHDFEFKAAHAQAFLMKGEKVCATVVFSGRQIIYKDRGYALIDMITKRLDVVGKRDTEPKMEGRFLRVFFIAEKHKVDALKRKMIEEKKNMQEVKSKDGVEKAQKHKEVEKKRKGKLIKVNQQGK